MPLTMHERRRGRPACLHDATTRQQVSSFAVPHVKPTYGHQAIGGAGSNTSKTRTHSLFRQGCMLYDLIPNMPEHRLLPLMQKFNEAISNAAVLSPVFVVVQ
jgi:hypothetical protein